MPRHGAYSPFIISDYIDHLELTKAFFILNNLKYSLTSLALAILACLLSFFVNARVCSKPQTGYSQETNHQARKQSKKQNKMGLGGCGPLGRGGGAKNFPCAPSDRQFLVLGTVPVGELPGYGAFRLDAENRRP